MFGRMRYLDRILLGGHNRVDMSSEFRVHQRLWKMDERRYVTAIVKATFAIHPDGQLAPVVTSVVNTEDKTEGNMPMASIRAAREDMPYLARPEVVLRAYAYPDESGTHGQVQMIVTREEAVLIDKSAMVYGQRSSLGASPQSFERILLGYERALGGIGFSDNPLGTGSGSMTNKLPNIVHPQEPEDITIGFGAVGDAWPNRKKLRANFSFKILKARVAEIPVDIDWACFQVAPRDQQIDELRGDETFRLRGVRPNGEEWVFSLPNVRPHAQVIEAETHQTGENIALRLDTVSIDAMENELTLVWRGYVAVAAATDAEQVRVVGGLDSGAESAAPEATGDLVDGASNEETVVFAAAASPPPNAHETLDATSIEMIRRGAVMPFRPNAKATVSRKVAQTAAAYIPGDDAEAFTGTVALSSTGPSESARALPFDQPIASGEGPGGEADAAVVAAKAEKARLKIEAENEEKSRVDAEREREAQREASVRQQASAEAFERAEVEASEVEKQREALKEQRRQEQGKNFRSASYGGVGRRKKD